MSDYVRNQIDRIHQLRAQVRRDQEAEERDQRDRQREDDNPRLAALRELVARSTGNETARRNSRRSDARRGYSDNKRNRDFDEEEDDEVDYDSGVSPSMTPQPQNVASLRQAVGLPLAPKPLSESALIVIDAQNTYTEGALRLFKIEPALKNIKGLLSRARKAEIPIFHIAHDAGVGSAYDVKGHSGAFIPAVKPENNEGIVIKNYPSSFEKTKLHESLQALEIKNLVIVGFMTHCCVNSTARAAFNLGYESVTVVADCTATRALPDPSGKKDAVPASVQQRAALAAINDLHCNVVKSASFIED